MSPSLTVLARALFPALALLASCAIPVKTASTTKAIFGNDDRVSIDISQAPWSAIGRTSIGCTGTLIDTDKVLTAKHCVVDFDHGGGDRAGLKFMPRYGYTEGGNPAWPTANVSRVSYLPGTTWVPADDFAIMTLDQDLGSTYGIINVGLSTSATAIAAALPYTVSLYGYSADTLDGQAPSAHLGCHITSVPGGRLNHDCDLTGGASGGPLIATDASGSPFIVGVQSGEYTNAGTESWPTYSDANANFASVASRIAELPAPHAVP